MNRKSVIAAAALVALFAVAAPASAQRLAILDGVTSVWVKVRALPGEGLWQACRRVYGRDVYKVRRDRNDPGIVWCSVDYSAL